VLHSATPPPSSSFTCAGKALCRKPLLLDDERHLLLLLLLLVLLPLVLLPLVLLVRARGACCCWCHEGHHGVLVGSLKTVLVRPVLAFPLPRPQQLPQVVGSVGSS
jgi:hypothetical protein